MAISSCTTSHRYLTPCVVSPFSLPTRTAGTGSWRFRAMKGRTGRRFTGSRQPSLSSPWKNQVRTGPVMPPGACTGTAIRHGSNPILMTIQYFEVDGNIVFKSLILIGSVQRIRRFAVGLKCWTSSLDYRQPARYQWHAMYMSCLPTWPCGI